jgi:hypothetical protein
VKVRLEFSHLVDTGSARDVNLSDLFGLCLSEVSATFEVRTHDDTYRDDIIAHKKHELFQIVDWFTTRKLDLNSRVMDYQCELGAFVETNSMTVRNSRQPTQYGIAVNNFQ